jgi:hypothetical protein
MQGQTRAHTRGKGTQVYYCVRWTRKSCVLGRADRMCHLSPMTRHNRASQFFVLQLASVHTFANIPSGCKPLQYVCDTHPKVSWVTQTWNS